MTERTWPEYSSAAGARKLAAKIQLYWQKRGYDVEVRIETVNSSNRDKRWNHMCVVRSDMIDAMPRRKLAQ